MNPKVIIVQPLVPTYRVDFYNRLADTFGSAFCVRASKGNLGELTAQRDLFHWEKPVGPMLRFLPGILWQRGALSIPVNRGDVIVVAGEPRNLANLLLMLKARMRGAKVVWWGHYWSSTSKHWRFKLRLMLMRLSHALVFYTDKEVNEYRALTPQNDRRPVFALNNGIDVQPIVGVRTTYRPQDRERRLFFVGRLTEKAELDVLLQAMARPCMKSVYLDIVGGGEEEGALKALAASLELEDRITWHPGTTIEAEIGAVANQARLFVYPGGVGLSLIHSMAYGLPAIVHDDRLKQMPEIAAFEDDKNGRYFKRGNVDDLANTIAAVIDDTALLDQWSKYAQETAEERYNTEVMATRFVEMVSHMRDDGAATK